MKSIKINAYSNSTLKLVVFIKLFHPDDENDNFSHNYS